MVDSVGLFAHTEFCNLVGYPFLLFFLFFFTGIRGQVH